MVCCLASLGLANLTAQGSTRCGGTYWPLLARTVKTTSASSGEQSAELQALLEGELWLGRGPYQELHLETSEDFIAFVPAHGDDEPDTGTP